jgi:hypothetical protein
MAVSKYLHIGRNPLSAFLKGIAFELEEARDSMFSTLNAMAIFGADGKYLDLWGDYIDVKRTESENDNDYAHRIMFQLKQNRVNNKSIEILVKEILGYEVEVEDLGWSEPDSLLYMNNGATFINNMDYAMWNNTSYVSHSGGFHVKLIDPLYSSLSTAEKANLSVFIDSVKQIGTKAYYTL